VGRFALALVGKFLEREVVADMARLKQQLLESGDTRSAAGLSKARGPVERSDDEHGS
jgi:hypothetical protein